MSEPAAPAPPAVLDRVRRRPGGRSARTRARVLDAARLELLDGGYAALPHRAVAGRAGVDPATVYRRWPTRPRLAADALLHIAAEAVPDTGRLESDLEAFGLSVAGALADPRIPRLFHALSAAAAEADTDLRETLRAFWEARFAGAEVMVARGVQRGELPAGADARATIEQLVAPVYFRATRHGRGLGGDLVRDCVSRALAASGARAPRRARRPGRADRG